jgi:hypothetical protein
MMTESDLRDALLCTILEWEGRLNNTRLRELLDVKITRASVLLGKFRDAHPNWVDWDTFSKSYIATNHFYNRRAKAAGSLAPTASLAHYLSLVQMSHVSMSGIEHSHIWSGYQDLSTPVPQVFATISEAIRSGRMLKMLYRSMRNPEPHERLVSPHSLVRAGRRWHVRAFCAEKKEFRDYALGRIQNPIILDGTAENSVSDDATWNTVVKVQLVAHPALNESQRKLVEFEYFSGTAARADLCRAALLSYYIQDIRAALDVEKERPPEYQLSVFNKEELSQWLFPG